MFNRALFIGEPIGKPELRYDANGQEIAIFSIRVVTSLKGNSGSSEEILNLKVITTGKLVEKVTHDLKDASTVVVEGRLRGRKGKIEVVATGIKVLNNLKVNSKKEVPF